MQKLERLLGHKFGIREDTLELHVDKTIDSSIKKYNFKIATIDTTEIDWENLISRSVTRKPPFEANEKEKGFRDSIIAHSFLHLHKNSPATPSVCRLALISQDQRLKEYVSELTIDSKNIRLLSSLDELESLINTLVSTIPEEYATELSEKAEKLFFEKANNKSFYYKESIGEKIREQYSKELNNTIIPDHSRSGGTWWISKPIFIKKKRQRIHWITIVEPEFEIFHYTRDEERQNKLPELSTELSPPLPSSAFQIANFPFSNVPHTQTGGLLSGFTTNLGFSGKKVVDIKGKEKFEVHWSTNLSQAQNLTAPKLDRIQYLGNNLTEDSA